MQIVIDMPVEENEKISRLIDENTLWFEDIDNPPYVTQRNVNKEQTE